MNVATSLSQRSLASRLAFWLALPAPAARAIFERYPSLREPLVSNWLIPSDTWDATLVDTVHDPDIWERLLANGSKETLAATLNDTDATQRMLRAIFHFWYLPNSILATVIDRLYPYNARRVLSETWQHQPTWVLEQLLQKAEPEPTLELLKFLTQNSLPVSDRVWSRTIAQFEGTAAFSKYPFGAQASLIAQRPQCVAGLVRSSESLFLPMYSAFASPSELPEVVSLITKATRSPSLNTRHRAFQAAMMLIWRWDTPKQMRDDVISVAFPLSSDRERLRSSTSRTPPGAMAFPAVSSKVRSELFEWLISSIKTPDSSLSNNISPRLVSAVQLLSFLADPSSTFNEWNTALSVLLNVLEPAALAMWRSRFAAHLPASKYRTLPCSVTPHEPFSPVDVSTPVASIRDDVPTIPPNTEWWETHRNEVKERFHPTSITSYVRIPTHESAACWLAISQWLTAKLGDGSSHTSLDAWMAFFAFAVVAPPSRTLNELIAAVRSQVPLTFG